jgi:hypothetical protein
MFYTEMQSAINFHSVVLAIFIIRSPNMFFSIVLEMFINVHVQNRKKVHEVISLFTLYRSV